MAHRIPLQERRHRAFNTTPPEDKYVRRCISHGWTPTRERVWQCLSQCDTERASLFDPSHRQHCSQSTRFGLLPGDEPAMHPTGAERGLNYHRPRPPWLRIRLGHHWPLPQKLEAPWLHTVPCCMFCDKKSPKTQLNSTQRYVIVKYRHIIQWTNNIRYYIHIWRGITTVVESPHDRTPYIMTCIWQWELETAKGLWDPRRIQEYIMKKRCSVH